MSKRNPNPVDVYLRMWNGEQLEATFYNEETGFSALQLARQFAKYRTPEGQLGRQWKWRFVRRR